MGNLAAVVKQWIGLFFKPAPMAYETVAAGQTAQALGDDGAKGDYLDSLVCVVATAATAQVQIKDGSDSAITVLPNSPGGGVGTYTIKLGLRSRTGAWQVTTGAGVSVIATGMWTDKEKNAPAREGEARV